MIESSACPSYLESFGVQIRWPRLFNHSDHARNIADETALTLLGHLISNSFDQFEEFFAVGPGELKKFVRHVLQTFHSRTGVDLIGTRVLKEHHRGDNGLEQWLTVHLTLPELGSRASTQTRPHQ